METDFTAFDNLPEINNWHFWMGVLDIALVLFLIFQVYKFVRGTVAIRIFFGAVAIYMLWKVFEYLEMELMGEILGQFIGVGMIALIVVFQQEIRKFLLLIATPKIYNRFVLTKWLFRMRRKAGGEGEIDKKPIVSACERLSKTKTGALIVITKELDMEKYRSLGESIDAELGAPLLVAIFNKESPLHDGAVMIYENRILAARCVLPITDRVDIPDHLGLRHRAAIGITEHSDAIAIVVSEENGRISVCNGGKFRHNVSAKRLEELINFLPE